MDRARAFAPWPAPWSVVLAGTDEGTDMPRLPQSLLDCKALSAVKILLFETCLHVVAEFKNIYFSYIKNMGGTSFILVC